MSAVSKNVTPASSAASTTARVASSSMRPPKLLQPRPDDADGQRPEVSCSHVRNVSIACGVVRYWEDFHVGEVSEVGPVTVTEEEIIDFALAVRPTAVPHRPGSRAALALRRADRKRLAYDARSSWGCSSGASSSTPPRSARRASTRSAGPRRFARATRSRAARRSPTCSPRRRTRNAERSSRPTRCSIRTACS